MLYLFFFFSSRRRHTRSLCDWSSDVCSSDLKTKIETEPLTNYNIAVVDQALNGRSYLTFTNTNVIRSASGRDANVARSEERRVGKSVDLGGRRIIKKKKEKKMKVISNEMIDE